MLTKFDLHRAIHTSNPNELFACVNCISHKNNYINPFEKFTLNFQMGNQLLGITEKAFIMTVKTFYTY